MNKVYDVVMMLEWEEMEALKQGFHEHVHDITFCCCCFVLQNTYLIHCALA